MFLCGENGLVDLADDVLDGGPCVHGALVLHQVPHRRVRQPLQRLRNIRYYFQNIKLMLELLPSKDAEISFT